MSEQRVVLITGAARGIGFATAKVFAQQGDTVYLVDRNQALLEMAVDSLKQVGRGAKREAVNMITQVMGLELAPHGIKVTAIAPGYVHTEILEQVFRERGPIEGMTPEEYEQFPINKVPAGRLASPEDIAKLVRFLASDDADYITGVTVTSAGGTILI